MTGLELFAKCSSTSGFCCRIQSHGANFDLWACNAVSSSV